MVNDNSPSMISEVIEAIHLMYEDLPDVELDCMLYIKSLVAGNPRATSCVMNWFNEHDRCEECGTPLMFITYKEPHPELDGCPQETLSEPICPVCERVTYD